MNPIIDMWIARIAHGVQSIPPVDGEPGTSQNGPNDTAAAPHPAEHATPSNNLGDVVTAPARDAETVDGFAPPQPQAVDETPKKPPSRAWLMVASIGAVLLVGAAAIYVALSAGSTTSRPRTVANGNSFSATAIQDLPTTAATRSPTVIGVVPAPPGFTNVIIAKNVGAITGNVCQTGTLHLSWTLIGIAPATPVVIALNGRGLPPELIFQANPNQPFGRDYPVSGAGQWSDTIVSIAGKPPPASGSHDMIPVQC
jgi:hypothetical protein